MKHCSKQAGSAIPANKYRRNHHDKEAFVDLDEQRKYLTVLLDNTWQFAMVDHAKTIEG
jgi:hypothetical protein